MLRGYVGTDLPKHTSTIKTVECPFTGELLTAVPAINPDVGIIHAQRADRDGNVQIWGLVGVQKEAVLASQAIDRHRRGDRRRAAAGRRARSCCRRGWSARCATCRAARTRASRWATRARQRVLQGMGRHLEGPRRVHRVDRQARRWARPTSPSTARAWGSDGRLHHRRADDRQRRAPARRPRRGRASGSASSASACRRPPPTSPAACTRSSRC